MGPPKLPLKAFVFLTLPFVTPACLRIRGPWDPKQATVFTRPISLRCTSWNLIEQNWQQLFLWYSKYSIGKDGSLRRGGLPLNMLAYK